MRLQLCSAFPSFPFEIIASVYMRLGHDEDATTQANCACFCSIMHAFARTAASRRNQRARAAQVVNHISVLQDMLAPKVTAAMAADAMLKCADDIDAAAFMLMSVSDRAPL